MPQWWYELSYDPLIASTVAAVVASVIVAVVTLTVTRVILRHQHCSNCCPDKDHHAEKEATHHLV